MKETCVRGLTESKQKDLSDLCTVLCDRYVFQDLTEDDARRLTLVIAQASVVQGTTCAKRSSRMDGPTTPCRPGPTGSGIIRRLRDARSTAPQGCWENCDPGGRRARRPATLNIGPGAYSRDELV